MSLGEERKISAELEGELSEPERGFLLECLMQGETALWAAHPVPVLWTKKALGTVVFAIPWLSFTAFWTYMVLLPGGESKCYEFHAFQIGMALFSIPFWLIGFVLLFSPWLQRRKLRRSFYVLTNRRALIAHKEWSSWKLSAYGLDPDLIIERFFRKDGTGDLVFGYAERSSPPDPLGFLGVRHPQAVEEFIGNIIAKNQEDS